MSGWLLFLWVWPVTMRSDATRKGANYSNKNNVKPRRYRALSSPSRASRRPCVRPGGSCLPWSPACAPRSAAPRGSRRRSSRDPVGRSLFPRLLTQSDSVPRGRDYGFGARRDAERHENRVRVLLHRIGCDRKLGGDALVVVALEDEAQHILLPIGELERAGAAAHRPLRRILDRLRRHVGP